MRRTIGRRCQLHAGLDGTAPASDEFGQYSIHPLQSIDLPADFRLLRFGKRFPYAGVRGVLRITFEQGFDLGDREACSLGKLDETKREQRTIIELSTAGNPPLTFDQPHSFVVANG